MKNKRLCDPTWNYFPRTFLLYILPLGLMSFFLYNNLIGFSRDFWVPFVFALIAPTLNVKRKFWVLKDFQNRDCYIYSMPFLFAGIWSLCIIYTPYLWMAVVSFIGFFLIFSFLLVKYEILKIYSLKVETLKRGLFKKFFACGVTWWTYVGIGFLLVHKYGTDTWLSMAVCSALVILPIQVIFVFIEKKCAKPERFQNIKKLAVIGAGFAGVYATKWLTENNIEVECFEKSSSIGGVWKFREEEKERATVFRNTRATSSKHFMHAMDFRVPEEFPDFPHNLQYMEFLESYVDNFNVRDKIELNTEIRNIEKQDGKWSLSLFSQSEEKTRMYDAVVVCSGPQAFPRHKIADDPLYSKFTGKIIHTSEYKDNSLIEGNDKVLIVGAGESSADIVAECVDKKCKVFWSAHSGQWYADRNVGPFAIDHVVAVGFRQLLGKFFNIEYLIRRYVVQVYINMIWGRGGHGVKEWMPKTPYLHQFLNKSRDGILEIYKGNVTPKRAVTEINGNKVKFAEEEEFLEFDKIILATGFIPNWPFLKDTPAKLFKFVFDPQNPTLSFISLARPVIGSITSIADIQARWVASVYSGQTTLPNESMRESILYEDLKDQNMRFKDTNKLKIYTDQDGYTHELASFMGIQVKWLKLLFFNPKAFWTMLWTPWTAFQFQLSNKDKDIREEALQNIRAEMPPSIHPLYAVVWFILQWLFCAAAGAVAIFYFLPLWQVCGIYALFLFVMAIHTRMRDLAVFSDKGT